jgi:hypothetical protein
LQEYNRDIQAQNSGLMFILLVMDATFVHVCVSGKRLKTKKKYKSQIEHVVTIKLKDEYNLNVVTIINA